MIEHQERKIERQRKEIQGYKSKEKEFQVLEARFEKLEKDHREILGEQGILKKKQEMVTAENEHLRRALKKVEGILDGMQSYGPISEMSKIQSQNSISSSSPICRRYHNSLMYRSRKYSSNQSNLINSPSPLSSRRSSIRDRRRSYLRNEKSIDP